jgi:hypothetical protein
MNVDYESLQADMESGVFRQTLEEELTIGFRLLHQSGEHLPLASYYAAKIAEIVNSGAEEPLRPETAFYLYQEILSAVESARTRVLGEPIPPVA